MKNHSIVIIKPITYPRRAFQTQVLALVVAGVRKALTEALISGKGVYP